LGVCFEAGTGNPEEVTDPEFARQGCACAN